MANTSCNVYFATNISQDHFQFKLSFQHSAVRSIWNAQLPWAAHGPSKALGRPPGCQDCPPWRKKALVFCIYVIIYLFILCFCVSILRLCICMPTLDWLYRTKPHKPMLPCPDRSCHTKCVVLPADTNLGAEWSGLDILLTTAWSYSLYRFISYFFLFS